MAEERRPWRRRRMMSVRRSGRPRFRALSTVAGAVADLVVEDKAAVVHELMRWVALEEASFEERLKWGIPAPRL